MAVPSPSSPSHPRRWHRIHFPADSLCVSRLSCSILFLRRATVSVSAVATSCIHQTAEKQHLSFFFLFFFFSGHCVSWLYLCQHTNRFPVAFFRINCSIWWRGNVLANTPSLSLQQIDLQKHTTGSHEGKSWCRNPFRGNRTFQQCFHTFAAVIIAAGTIRNAHTTSWNMKVTKAQWRRGE